MPELHFDIQMGLRDSLTSLEGGRQHDGFGSYVDGTHGSTACSLDHDQPSFNNPTLTGPLYGHKPRLPAQPYLQSISRPLIESDGLVRSWTASGAQLEPPCPGWGISAEFAVDGNLIADDLQRADGWVPFKIHVSFFDGFNWKDKATHWAQVCPTGLSAHLSGRLEQSWHSIGGAMDVIQRDVNMNAAVESLPNTEYMSDELRRNLQEQLEQQVIEKRGSWQALRVHDDCCGPVRQL
ncbi:hypothetical protein NliqN6_4581 [Naganishia liquefaciens]|uniref:Uncharacterized protein n=1 Tax=Naganishia liquefaciens TaxID=104408 RepID=A0A8H3YG05_9TREE|nr:hypothetical protein NliqN6_4581 [Naganishia liquefaciens]